MAETKKEILETALQLEEDGQKFYLDVATKTENALVKAMFESLAKDEAGHMRWIKNMAPEEVDLKAHSTKLYDSLRGIFADASEEVKRAAESADSDIEAAKLAQEKEKDAIKVYGGWAEASEDEAVKLLFASLKVFETFHLTVLQNAIEYMDSPENWFMNEEGWIFDGGTSTT